MMGQYAYKELAEELVYHQKRYWSEDPRFRHLAYKCDAKAGATHDGARPTSAARARAEPALVS